MSLQSEPGTPGQPRGHGGRPSRLESAQLSDRILDVATGLFLSDGFGATSIEAVAKRAGISKRTFYHRFNGKEMLFEAVVRRLIERWTPPFDTALLEAPDLAEALRHVAEHMLKVAPRRGGFRGLRGSCTSSAPRPGSSASRGTSKRVSPRARSGRSTRASRPSSSS
jgi:AcrR family transcriptional regulator